MDNPTKFSLSNVYKKAREMFTPANIIQGIAQSNPITGAVSRAQQALNDANAQGFANTRASQSLERAGNRIVQTATNFPTFQFSDSLSQRVRNPYIRPVAQMALSVPEGVANIPSQLIRGSSRIGEQVGRASIGDRVNTQRLLSGVGNLGESFLNAATLGSAPEALGSIGKQGFKSTVKQGALEGAKYGGAFGVLSGLKDDSGTLKDQLIGSLTQGAAGAALGGAIGGIGAGTGFAGKKIAEDAKKIQQDSLEKLVNKSVALQKYYQAMEGYQGRDGLGKYRTKIPDAVEGVAGGKIHPLADSIPRFEIKGDHDNSRKIVTAEELISIPNWKEKILGPFNAPAKKEWRMAFEGGFLNLGEEIGGPAVKDVVPENTPKILNAPEKPAPVDPFEDILSEYKYKPTGFADEVAPLQSPPFSPKFGGQSTPDSVRVDQEAVDSALGNLLDENANINETVKGKFSDWVKARQATKIQEYVKKKQFSEFDQEGVNGILRFQSGDKQGLSKIQNYFDKKYAELQSKGVNFNFKEDYLPQLWNETPERVNDVLGKKIGKKPSFALDSIFKTYQEGIDAGLTPKFTTLSDLVGWYEGRANKAIADTEFFNGLISDELVKPSSKVKGWVILDPDRFPRFSSSIESSGGGKEFQGTYAAPKELADLINNYLRTPEGPIADIAKYVSRVKNVALSSGIPGTGINAHGVNILSRNTLASNNPVSGFLRGTGYILNPNSAEKWINKNLEKTEFAAKSGVTFNIEDHAFEDLAKQTQNGLKGKIGEAWSNAFEKPLFNKVIPALKVQYFDSVYSNLEKQVGPEEAARTASTITNNIFGGINTEAMGRNREFSNILRSAFLAPDWAETQLKLGGNIVKGVLNPRRPEGKAYRTFARNLVMAYTAMNVANKVSSGHYLWENEPGHTFEVEAGYTSDGKKRYIRPLGTSADFARLPYDVALSLSKGDLSSVARVVRNRLSIPAGVAAGVLTNTDYRGRKQFGADIPVNQQLGNAASNVAQLVGFPSQLSAGIDRASGKINNEQFLAQLTEVPLRYVGGASTKTQKDIEPALKRKGIQGKDLFEAMKSVRGESFSDNQKRMIQNSGLPALQNILRVRELNRQVNERASGRGGGKSPLSDTGVSKAYAAESTPEDITYTQARIRAQDQSLTPNEISSYYLRDLNLQKGESAYQNSLHEKEVWSRLSSLENSDSLTDSQKELARKTMLERAGISSDDYDYHEVSKQSADLRTLYANEKLTSLFSSGAKPPQVYQWLVDNTREVNGKKLLTSEVINSLVSENILSKADGDVLKKIKTSGSGKSQRVTSLAKRKSSRVRKGPKFKFSPIRSRRRKLPKVKLAQLKLRLR